MTLTTLDHATRLADLALRYRDALLETGAWDSCEATLAEIRLLDAIDLLWPDCVTDIRNTRADELASDYGIGPDGLTASHYGSELYYAEIEAGARALRTHLAGTRA